MSHIPLSQDLQLDIRRLLSPNRVPVRTSTLLPILFEILVAAREPVHHARRFAIGLGQTLDVVSGGSKGGKLESPDELSFLFDGRIERPDQHRICGFVLLCEAAVRRTPNLRRFLMRRLDQQWPGLLSNSDCNHLRRLWVDAPDEPFVPFLTPSDPLRRATALQPVRSLRSYRTELRTLITQTRAGTDHG